jgi:hypothetical protein
MEEPVQRQRRAMRRAVVRAAFIVAVFALGSPFAVCAQATQVERAARPILLTGGKLSARPLHETVTGGILIPVLRPEPAEHATLSYRGVIVEAGVGVGGYELSAGWGNRLKSSPDALAVIGQDVRATAFRVRDSVRQHATYIGGEAGLTFATLRVSLGAARRVNGPETADPTIFTFGVGLQIGF